jgi:predicted GTPase
LSELRNVDRVEILDGEPDTKAAVRAWAGAEGVEVVAADPDQVDPPDGVRVIAVSSPRTGCGKTWLTRRVARGLRRSGVAVAVARHPMPNLLRWPGRAPVDLLREVPADGWPQCVKEECEPILEAGVPVAVGTDAQGILEAAADAASGPRAVVVWDGGGSAQPWVRPDYHFVVLDALRPPGDEAEHRVRSADVVVIAKVDSSSEERVREIEGRVRTWNPAVELILADLLPQVPEGPQLVGARVVVVEDAPSLLLGGLKAGAGAVAARRFRCGVIDPRPFAVGSVAEALERHPHVGAVIPSVGRTPQELDDLHSSVRRTPGDAVLWASPAAPPSDLGAGRPVMRVLPELMEVAGPALQEVLRPFLPGAP